MTQFSLSILFHFFDNWPLGRCLSLVGGEGCHGFKFRNEKRAQTVGCWLGYIGDDILPSEI